MIVTRLDISHNDWEWGSTITTPDGSKRACGSGSNFRGFYFHLVTEPTFVSFFYFLLFSIVITRAESADRLFF